MKKRKLGIFILAFVILTMLVGCSSSTSNYDSTGETIREQLGNGPADAYYEGKSRWNKMTGQD